MKILMINVVCGIRSTGRICTDLAAALETKGHVVKIAYGRENVPDQFQKYAVRIGTNLDSKIHGLQARFFDSAGFGSTRATKKFIQWVKDFDPDVIHLHNLHGYFINVEILFEYLKTCGKKIIWTLHDCWAFTGHSAYCDAISCERWVDGCYNCPQIKEYPRSYIDHSNCNWKKKGILFKEIPNMTIITPSKWLEGLVKKSFLSEYPVQVIHNGIDTKQFYPMENDFRNVYGLQNKFIILGVATNWDDMKGYSDFLSLAEVLEDSCKIILVGLNEQQAIHLPDKILGIKRTESIKELAAIYSMADVFVNLTYCDNYPTVNIEAISCGTPVLTYETGGSTEIVEKYGGYVVPKGDLKAIEEQIKKIMAGETHIQFNSTENDISVAVNEYLKILSKGRNQSV